MNGADTFHLNGISSPYTINTLQGGTYRLNKITDNNNCAAVDFGAAAIIVRNPLPTGAITTVSQICSGDSAQLVFSLTGQAPWKVSYQIGSTSYTDYVFGLPYKPYIMPASSSYYKIIQLLDGNKCTATNIGGTKLITVNPVTGFALTTSSTAMTYCNSNDGKIKINATLDGNGPYTYSIKDTLSFGVNYEFDNLSLGTYPMYIKNKYGCISKQDANIKAGNTPDPPTVSSNKTVYCFGVTMDSIFSSSKLKLANRTFKWYYTSDLLKKYPNNYWVNDSIVLPRSDTLGIVSYYVTQGNDTCESLPAKIAITINPSTAKPIATDTSICYTANAATNPKLLATGKNDQWYMTADKSFGAIQSGSSYKPVNINPGTYSYYVTQTLNGCESPVDTSIFIIKPLPSAAYTNNESVCNGAFVPLLFADTIKIRWYSDYLAKNFLDTGNYYNTHKTVAGTYYYYATQTELGCEGPTNSASLSIVAKPAMPKASDVITCEGTTVPALYSFRFLYFMVQ